MENFSFTSIPDLKDTNLTVKSFLAKPSPVPSAVTFTLGVTGNIIAIFFLFKASKSHKWNVFYRFVTALAMTDLFGILTTSPVAFAVYDNDLVWVGGQPLCHYLSFMLTFAGVATVVFVGAMALDRYLAITFPFKYSQWNKDTIVNIIIIAIWIGSVFVACLPLMGLGHNIKQFPGTWCFFNFFGTTVEDQIFSYFYASIGLGVILMTAILNILVIVALTHGKRSHARRGSISSKSARARTDIYITVFLVAIFATFAICWTPFMIRIIINSTGVIKIDRRTDLITLRLATLNQILDPWVYILFRREVLVKITKFIRKRRKGSFLVRLASFTSSFKSHVSDPEQMGNLDKEKQIADVITPLQEDIKPSQDGDKPSQDDEKPSQDDIEKLTVDVNSGHQDQNGLKKLSQEDIKQLTVDIYSSHQDHNGQANTTDNQIDVDEAFIPTNNIE
ncbi:prostaglandin E receptor 4 [Mytilus galloprovincialis]|uniref:Thromboxane A2 receptor n=1 Tax=Mytilus galloprovincialis TaxID=29158 RepID=A0A8B6FLL6_MYTGA|nr:prostaglandin E receptor 4 [Mytilus galloprovincialis]